MADRFEDGSLWVYKFIASHTVGVTSQLLAFFEPSAIDIRLPIFHGALIVSEMFIVTGALVSEKHLTAVFSAAIFGVAYSLLGYFTLLELFFEEPSEGRLPEAEDVSDAALAFKVISFLYPLIGLTQELSEIMGDHLKRLVQSETNSKTAPKKLLPNAAKGVIAALYAGAAVWLMCAMASPDFCHDYRTCARGDCEPDVPLGLAVDADPITGNIFPRMRMLNEDATQIWRVQGEMKFSLSFTRSSGSLLAQLDLTQSGVMESKVSEPGAQTEVQVRTSAVTPTTCSATFKVECMESNPRLAFQHLSDDWEWVAYNKSVTRWTPQDPVPQCWSATTGWWTEMLAIGPSITTGSSSGGTRKAGLVFAPAVEDCTEGRKCIDAPPYVATYAPYGRASVTGDWETVAGDAIDSTWFTGTYSFRIDVDEQVLGAVNNNNGGQQNPQPNNGPGSG